MADRDRLLLMLKSMLVQLKSGDPADVETAQFKLIIKPTKKNIDLLNKGILIFMEGTMSYSAVIVMIVAGGC